MNTSGEAADQVLRMMLNGTEVLVKLTGTGAKNAAVLLYSIARQQKKTKGSARLETMIRSGKPLKVYSFRDSDLPKFKEVAKQYGILYTVLKEKDKTGGVFDVMVRAEDENKIARIIERFELTKVDVADIRAEIVKEKEEKKESEQQNPPETEHPEKSADEILAEEILAKPVQREEQTNENPPAARTDSRQEPRSESQSEPQSGNASSKNARDMSNEGKSDRKPSVKKKIEDIKKERADKSKSKSPEVQRGKSKTQSKNKNKNKKGKSR